jgi:iron-sulfur cluster repair protein YtfE (RIC family)
MTHECSCRHEVPIAPGQPLPSARPEQTVADIAQHRAGGLETMKELGINHCCGAHLTLQEAAAAAGVPLDTLLAALNAPTKAPA